MKPQIFTFIVLAALLVFTACQKEEENTIPQPIFVVNPDAGSVDTEFFFDATMTADEEDDAEMIEIRWDWNGDGRWDTDFTTVKTATHFYDISKEYEVRMEARDLEGWSNIVRAKIFVFPDSVPPVAAFDIIPVSGNTSRIFNFDASSSRNDNLEDPQLRFRWDWENDGEWDTDYSSFTKAYHRYHSPGTYNVTLEVINKIDLTSTITKPVVVTE